MRTRIALLITSAALWCCACGGGPRSQAADLVAIHQPTPDPTLDAVVRDLPRALAGVAPTPTPTPLPVVVRQAPAPTTKQAAPTAKPSAPKPTPTTARH